MNLSQKLKLWYPENVLEPATPYVYFNSLLSTETGKYIYNTVEPYYSRTLGEASPGHAQTKITSALNFLEKVVQAEYQKEASFIQFLNKKITQSKVTLTVPTQTEDWSNFIQEVQSALNTSADIGVKNLLNELHRLKTNDAILQKADESAYFTHSLDDQVNAISDFLKKTEATIMVGHQGNDISQQIYDIVLSKFGADLFEIKNDQVILNRGQLAALIQTINALALKNYTIQTYTGETKFDAQKFQETVSDESFVTQIKQYIDNAKKLPWVTQDLMELFDINTNEITSETISKKEAQNILNSTSLYNTAQNHLSKLNSAIQNTFRRKDFFKEKAFKVTSQGNVLAEILSAVNFNFKGAFYAKNTGISGAKPDNVIALLTIDMDSLDPNRPEHQKILDYIVELRSIMDELTKSLKSTNTQKYYQTQQEKWKSMESRMETILKNISELYGTVVDCYTIEDSTKNYAYLNSKTKGVVNESFHGGSLGARLNDQLAKIEALAATGGFTMLDVNWLTNAIINSGPNMIANKNKNAIEQYLATFATILLFDDQVNIADEAINSIASTSGSSVNKIHLFSLNNGYYPISYVLNLTLQALWRGYDNILSEIESGAGAKVNIVNYISEPYAAYNGWDQTAKKALDSTKLEVQFMVHFMGLLETLFPTFS